jgi:hypothetical protein
LIDCATSQEHHFSKIDNQMMKKKVSWLIGMTEMTRTFGLELLEAVLTAFPEIFQSVRIIIDIILWISVVLFCIYFIQIISYI